jgi:hypothetical protein
LCLSIGPSSAAFVGGGIDVVDEPRPGPNGRADPQRSILSFNKGLEVIVDYAFLNVRQIRAASRVKQDRVPTESFGHARHGGFGAMIRPRDLPMS